jgi:hypothetical protein
VPFWRGPDAADCADRAGEAWAVAQEIGKA